MSDLHVHALVSATTALEIILALAPVALVFNPRPECLGGIEMLLELADHIGGGDALGFMNGCGIFSPSVSFDVSNGLFLFILHGEAHNQEGLDRWGGL